MLSIKLNNLLSIFTFLCFCLVNITHSFDIRKGIYNRWITSKAMSQIKENLIYKKSHNLKKSKIIDDILKTIHLSQNNPIIKQLESLKKSEETYKELFVDVKVDHFSFENSATFKLRYLLNDKYFTSNPQSPILFYCGNEGPIEDFYNNTGFITEFLAKKFNALVIFGEHRFFGKSFPLGGNQDYDINKNKYLTSEQALSDFVDLLTIFKKEKNLNNPVIAFGGSYGGMLSSWARMKYPHVFAGAIASSAPVLLFEDIKKIENSFFKIVTKTYERYDSKCPSYIRSGFQKLFDMRNSTIISANPSVHKVLNDIFKPCTKIQNAADIKKLEDNIEDMIVTLAQYNYPYETSVFKPTPGEPVKVACGKISEIRNKTSYFGLSPLISGSINFGYSKYNQVDYDTKYKLQYLKAAIDVFFNSTGTEKCMDIGNSNNSSVNNTENLNGWGYMACSEMIMPMEKNGVTDMFNPSAWNLEEFTKECKKTWNTDVRPTWIYDFYGGRDFYKEINNYSKIFYINGKMDPWNAGCPRYSNNKEVIVYEADSAHHLDLRYPNEKDPESINYARTLTEILIKKWIQ